MAVDCSENFVAKPAKNESRLLGSSRFAICLMSLLAFLMLNMLRTNISLSMICMVRTRGPASDKQSINVTAIVSTESFGNTSFYGSDTMANRMNSEVHFPTNKTRFEGEFEWSRAFQGHVLSSYFYGYLSTMFLGGWLGGRYGGKHVVGIGLIVSSLATILTPAAVRLNDYLIIVLRVVVGMSTGLIVPTTASLGGLWYAPLERSLLTTISRNGITLGNIIAFFISTNFCLVSLDNGWPLSFYVTGGAGIATWILWNIFVYSSPDQHPRVSHREKEYIARTTGIKTSITQRPPFPWCKALTSPALLAVLCAQTTNTWFLYTALTSMPLYLRDVLQFDIKQNGIWLILPHALTLVVSIPSGALADWLIRSHILSTVVVRKIFQVTSSWGSSALLLALSFMDYDRRYIAVGLLTAISPIQTLSRSGYNVNPIDIAPRYSGEITGLSNTFATLSGILAPVVVGYFTTNGTKEEWQRVFSFAAGMFIFGGLIFLLFAKGSVLSWADLDSLNIETMVINPNEIKRPSEAAEETSVNETVDSEQLLGNDRNGTSDGGTTTLGCRVLLLADESRRDDNKTTPDNNDTIKMSLVGKSP